MLYFDLENLGKIIFQFASILAFDVLIRLVFLYHFSILTVDVIKPSRAIDN
jgi:hypothetical protein